MATSFLTSTVGGDISATQITGSSVGEWFFTMAAEAAGGSNVIQYSKVCALNDHGTDTASGVKIYLRGALDNWPSTAAATLTSSAAQATQKARFIGFDSAGDAYQEEVVLNATTNTTTEQFLSANMDRVEIRNTSSGALEEAIEEYTIKAGATTVGVVPGPSGDFDGRWSAAADLDIGLEPAVDGTTTIATADVAPSGVTFSRPRTLAGALSVPGGELAAGEFIGIWGKWTLKPGSLPSSDLQDVIAMRITAS